MQLKMKKKKILIDSAKVMKMISSEESVISVTSGMPLKRQTSSIRSKFGITLNSECHKFSIISHPLFKVSVQLASFSILFKLFPLLLTSHKNLSPRNSFDSSSLLSSSLEPCRCSCLETNVSITTHSSTFTSSRNFSNSFDSASRSSSYLGCSTLLIARARTTHLRPGRKNVGRHRASKLLFSCDCTTTLCSGGKSLSFSLAFNLCESFPASHWQPH